MVVLLINEESDDEASQEVSHEMKRQYFQKIQEFHKSNHLSGKKSFITLDFNVILVDSIF